MRNWLRRPLTAFFAAAVVTTLAVFLGAQPAQAGYVPFGSFDYQQDCEYAGAAGDGIAWHGWYCQGSISASGAPYQLYVYVIET
jgi:hypothetical protein